MYSIMSENIIDRNRPMNVEIMLYPKSKDGANKRVAKVDVAKRIKLRPIIAPNAPNICQKCPRVACQLFFKDPIILACLSIIKYIQKNRRIVK